MSYDPVDIHKVIQDDLKKMEGKLPDDEFCSPKVGPNYRIISEYMNSFRMERLHSKRYCDEALIVEKILPDGYLILNGHHRWAGALIAGVNKVYISIENPGPHYPGM